MSERISGTELLSELSDSVKNKFIGFFLNYQPLISAETYEICGAEALTRYNSKDGVKVFPDEFIPLLEQSYLIEEVGLWVLEQALLQCSLWRRKIATFKVSVNFSAVQFRNADIVQNIFRVLEETNMPGDALVIEVTESMQVEDMDRLARIISELKARDIQIAIDDFGTGYSDIRYLKQLDIDEVKIDRTFVRDICEGSDAYTLIAETTKFAKEHNIDVCFEGVETAEELAVIKKLNPNRLQGYLFDRPADAEYITKAYMQEDSEEYKKRERFIQTLLK